ncbi:four helix bundle protein [Gemmatimonas groenlandica]|uniref:Four helix bundle protein n=1 Tax=Gemmatimonas groenlandica TaxID=2732249 RepID=A0A6M4IQA2_9BACT|nr:four helix bundle protein [Gemmatimonas groenlandica]QJR36168.1 four helix bundle protein [Gemmatimonas groenlandica]
MGALPFGMPNHFDLRVYDAACQLSTVVIDSLDHCECNRVPGLRAQLISSVGSIAANTSEGAGRGTTAQFLNQLRIALGSANETRTHLMRARNEARLPTKPYFLCDSKALVTARMLASLIRRIEEDEARKKNERS